MNLSAEQKREKLIKFSEHFPVNTFPGLTTIMSPENTYFHSSKTVIKTIGCKSEEEAHDIPFKDIPAHSHTNHVQWSIDNKATMESKKVIRIISYGHFSDGWKVYLGHQKPIIDDESEEAIGVIGNYIDITENSFFDIGRLILMEKNGLKRKQFQYRIQSNQGFEGLCKREQEVLFWYLHNLNSPAISRRLSTETKPITPQTVRSYIRNAKLKLGVSTKEQLLEKCISIGFMATVPESLFID
jgi:DNA-binding CsgD family transcriptional regulator